MVIKAGEIMKKLKVSYIPPLAIKISILIWAAVVCTVVYFTDEIGLPIGILLGLVAYVAISNMGTTVEFGSGSVINCKYLFYKWKINLDNIENFSYSIGSHLAGSNSYSFDVRFHYNENGVEDCYKLNTKIGREDIRRCMDGESSKLEIMQIYRYAERLYPEKAKGYVQPESIF